MTMTDTMAVAHGANVPQDAGAARADRGTSAISAISVEWQHLWFAIARRHAGALAVVPGHPTATSLLAARALAAAGQVYGSAPVRFVDATAVSPQTAAATIAELERCAHEGTQCIVAVGSPLATPATIAVVRAVGAAVLVVPLGTGEVSAARRVVDAIGREHFVGAVASRPR